MNVSVPIVFCHGVRAGVLILGSLLLVSCSGPTTYTTSEHHAFAIEPGDLQRHGIAFITPSSITGREQDRQSLALTFAMELKQHYPDLRVVTLSETLGALNRAGLLQNYKQMFVDYEETGIFDYSSLKAISEVTGCRYIAQLKLAGFRQENTGRFGLLGLRLMETKRATLRVFLQIWDSEEGTIVWEGYEEMNYAKDTYSEQGVSFLDIAEAIAAHMVSIIPYREPQPDDGSQQAMRQPLSEVTPH